MLSSVRIRLTLWYVLVFGALLSAFSLVIYVALSRDLYSRLDMTLAGTVRSVAGSFQSETSENGGDAAGGAADALGSLQLSDADAAVYQGGHLLGRASAPEGTPPAPFDPESLAAVDGQVSYRTLDGYGREGGRQAVLAVRVNGQPDCYIVVTESLYDVAERLEALRRIFFFGLPAMLAAAGLGGFVMARKSLAPVVAMSNQAEQIGARNLHERLLVRNENDELGRLAAVFNELLSRLERSFTGMRTFMADASHELRTPISIIRGEADVALSHERDPEEYQEALAIIQEEAQRLSHLVDDLLALARADAGQRPPLFEELYLNDLVEECCRVTKVLAAQKGVALELRPADDIPFRGDQDLLKRMTLNLLDNAIKYTPSGGTVTVALASDGAAVKLVVADTGIGIPADLAPKIFERFFRVNKARSRADGGTGLGLAIARWAAETHNGTIEVTSSPGQGSSFTVRLPR
jgi:heavy metal sensor kinase